MEPVEWSDATADLAPLGRQLIEKYHWHLMEFPVRFCWRSRSRTRHKNTVLATAEIVRGRFANFVMTEAEKAMKGQERGCAMFWIEVARDQWEYLDDAQRYALLDHELCHCIIEENEDGDEVMAMVGHDLEEFRAIVQRHGLWLDDVKSFAEVIKKWVVDA